MKAISIHAPWTELIMRGHKDVENRSWPTSYRGPLLIHATKKIDIPAWGIYHRQYDIQRCQTGVILGVVELIACSKKKIGNTRWHTEGFYGYYLENPRCFHDPIPYKGQQRLYNIDEKVVRRELLRIGFEFDNVSHETIQDEAK